jgi:uncharacterized membrane protein
VFWVLALALLILVVGTLGRLPPVVASHFDGAGAPNGWAGRTGYAALVIVIGIPLPLIVIALVHAGSRRGPSGLNIPSRDYWMAPAHRAEAVELVRSYTWWLGVVLTATAAAVHLAVLHANALTPPHLSAGLIVPLLAVLVAVLVAWAVGWYRVLRPRPGR